MKLVNGRKYFIIDERGMRIREKKTTYLMVLTNLYRVYDTKDNNRTDDFVRDMH